MKQRKACNLVGWVGLCVAVGCGGTVTEISPDDDTSGSSSSSGSGSGSQSSGAGGTGPTSGSTSATRTSGSTTRTSGSSSSSGTGGSGMGGGGSDTTVASVTVGSATSSGAGGASVVTVTSSGTTTGAGGAVFGSVSTVTGPGIGGSGGAVNPDDCEVDYRYSGNDWCEIGYECNGRWVWAYCDSYSGDQWSCGCDTEYFYGNYTFTGVDDEDACPLAANLCMNPDEIEFTDPPVCAPVYQEQNNNYCSMEVECTQSQQIDDNITAERRDWQWIYCYGASSGWTCECNSGDGYISLTIEDANAMNLCPNMLDVCNSGELQGEGPKTCEPRSQFAQQDRCSAEQQCSQEASVDGTNVLVNSYISTSCTLASEGQWACDCYTAPGNTSFNIASSDGWEACSEASDACAVAAGAE